ncbi:DDB1- and CUL4-associated factor 5-like [Pollicipes pollicipes]|uniref:DDB1- and CUL4-associated factor 5-like n=1 Tax=Pollicipes pollicipes TaxID=41117 RepID=UPI00188521BA|nr:DDB1- and CUL4-associated factor 5-like [Pollicipes pollicipes]
MLGGNPVCALERRSLAGRGLHVSELLDARLEAASGLYHRDLVAHYGCINAIEFSASGALMASGGDDRRVLVWDVARTLSGGRHPVVPMVSQHLSNIFCLAFDAAERRVFSAGNDKQVIVHDLATGAAVDVFTEQQAVYGLSVDPCRENVFVASCENGRVLLFDLRMSLAEPHSLAEQGSSLAAYYSAMFSPSEPQLVATANSKTGAAVYDVRMPGRVLQRYGACRYGAMSARYSSDGRRLFVLRRRLPPVLYDLMSPTSPICQFDHPFYYNSCTMKSCCFAGSRDQFVLSGSDDFNLYMWRIPDNPETKRVSRAHAVLRGHRSIVNQVRYCPQNGLLASSGVEKIVKLWSPVQLPDSEGGLTFDPETERSSRRIPRQGEYVDMVVNAGDIFGNDFNQQSTDEDPRMLAFFDSLVQREIETLTTETDSSTEEDGAPSRRRGDSSDETADFHSYFAAASDLDNDPTDGCAGVSCPVDNIISRMIDIKRSQLMRAARLRWRRAAGVPASSDEETAADGFHSRHRRVLHKARYVWLPLGGAEVSSRYTARAPPAAASSDDSDGAPAEAAGAPLTNGNTKDNFSRLNRRDFRRRNYRRRH